MEGESNRLSESWVVSNDSRCILIPASATHQIRSKTEDDSEEFLQSTIQKWQQESLARETIYRLKSLNCLHSHAVVANVESAINMPELITYGTPIIDYPSVP
jgi:hypothetical protein